MFWLILAVIALTIGILFAVDESDGVLFFGGFVIAFIIFVSGNLLCSIGEETQDKVLYEGPVNWQLVPSPDGNKYYFTYPDGAEESMSDYRVNIEYSPLADEATITLWEDIPEESFWYFDWSNQYNSAKLVIPIDNPSFVQPG